MQYRLEILPSVYKDLENIQDWYVWKFSNQTAEKVTDHILDAVENLITFPNLGTITPDQELKQQGYRMLIMEKHIAIYKIIGDIIYIYCIFDGRRDYPSLFKTRLGMQG